MRRCLFTSQSKCSFSGSDQKIKIISFSTPYRWKTRTGPSVRSCSGDQNVWSQVDWYRLRFWYSPPIGKLIFIEIQKLFLGVKFEIHIPQLKHSSLFKLKYIWIFILCEIRSVRKTAITKLVAIQERDKFRNFLYKNHHFKRSFRVLVQTDKM